MRKFDSSKGDKTMGKVNSVIVEGTVVQKTEVRKLKSGCDFCEFKLRYIDTERNLASEFDCLVYDTLTSKVSSVKLGQTVNIIGRLRQDRWVEYPDKQRSRCVLIVEHLAKKSSTEESESSI